MMSSQTPHDPSRTLLRQVAKALSLPVEVFYSDAPGEAGELLMLMRLWAAIENKQARQRILTVARQEFERSSNASRL
jgi:antitoxin component of RelBE/YafQ-DinJ toxin-antitoxin module